MSYDLMAFEHSAAPATKREFLDWYREQTEWGADHGRDDPSIAASVLQAVYRDIVKVFPSMDEDLPEDLLRAAQAENRLAAYSLGPHVLVGAFPQEHLEDAYDHMRLLCRKHGAGFFDMSGEHARVFLPDGSELL